MNPGTAVSYDTNSLQTTNIITADIDHASGPDSDIQMFALTHANRSAIAYENYPSRTIPVTGTLLSTGMTFQQFEAFLDTFRGYFAGRIDKNLDIGYNGGTRRYIATAKPPQIKRPGGLNFAKYSIDMVCTMPFGQDVAATTALDGSASGKPGFGRTANSYTDSYTFLGSAPYQLPVATITLTAVTGGSNATMFFGNASNGQGIYITRNWTAGDVVVIDCYNNVVTVNGIATFFSGAFPEFSPGAQQFNYNDTLTTRTFNITINYNVLYF